MPLTAYVAFFTFSMLNNNNAFKMYRKFKHKTHTIKRVKESAMRDATAAHTTKPTTTTKRIPTKRGKEFGVILC